MLADKPSTTSVTRRGTRRLRNRPPFVHLIADILSGMSPLEKVVPCAVIAAALFVSSSRVTGQNPTPTEDGRSFALAASDDTLSDALSHVDDMLIAGELDIARFHEDTMIPGRVHERLGQIYKGLPVFGAQIVRQMDGRSVISVTGRFMRYRISK